ncbi:MAG: hypothetical protein JWQ54_4880 [Mucilaginibacter sp.]|nr:hypothetical protein [Mucilaginibacter sp.]
MGNESKTFVISINRLPQDRVLQIVLGFLQVVDAIINSIMTIAETLKLGKNEPYPMAAFAAVTDLAESLRVNQSLRIYKSLEFAHRVKLSNKLQVH